MPVSQELLTGFLVALARVSGIFWLIPLPGARAVPAAAKLLVSLTITLALFPVWPVPERIPENAIALVPSVLLHLAAGLAMSVAIAFLLEAFQLGMQMVGLQAGYSYASTIHPSSEADSTVLQVFMVLLSGLLFFSFDLHHHLLRLLAWSLARPLGDALSAAALSAQFAALQELGSAMWITGLRLAIPVVAILILVDLALALFGRLHSQVQLLSLAFPLKMLIGVGGFAAVLVLAPSLFRGWAGRIMAILGAVP
jgi:flagellar biosynthetic protein FliR